MPNGDLEREVVIVETAAGVAIVLAAWMLDPLFARQCAPAPAVDTAGLIDLDRLLRALGLRRTCSDELPPTKEVHHASRGLLSEVSTT